jgi:hypothetical protein
MQKCKRPATHIVYVVGKKKVGHVCSMHLERVKEVVHLKCVQLHIEKYKGDEMFCELPRIYINTTGNSPADAAIQR